MRLGKKAVFTVTSARNRGRGSLRTAIRRANRRRRRAAVRIEFAIGSGPATIHLTSPLPRIRFHGVIDGWTQPGFAGAPLIEVNGSEAKSGSGLRVTGGEITIRGLAVTAWPRHGIVVHDCTDIMIQGMRVGVAIDGATAVGNGGSGIYVHRATRCVIGGPGDQAVVSSGNGEQGVHFHESADARLTGSVVGADRAGRLAVPNGDVGVRMDDCPRAWIGGSGSPSGNLISGNTGAGIMIAGPGSADSVVTGNRIGTDASCRSALPNGSGLVVMDAPCVRIGGAGRGESNLISGNSEFGIVIDGVQARRAVVIGNRVGTDGTGRYAVPNAGTGIVFQGAPDGQVGGARPGEGNLVSGNRRFGIEITRPGSSGAVIIGNYVGADVDGQNSLPNVRSGILVYNAHDVRIGGLRPGEGNLISGGARAGVNIDGAAFVVTDFAGKGFARRNLVQGNLIGVDRSGERPLGNQLRGVLVNYAQDNTVADNVISNNGEDGILILGPETDDDPNLVPSGNRILRNNIGVTRSGASAGNGRHGVFVRHGTKNEIGGETEDDANVIANNQGRGIQFSGIGARTNFASPHNRVTDNAKGAFHQPREDAPTATSGTPAPGP